MIKKSQLLKEIKKNKIQTPLVKKALKQAKISHAGQERDDGSCGLENHIYPVTYSILRRYSGRDFLEDLVVLALLHDTMEDDENFDENACKKIFNGQICDNVKKLTKDERLLRSYSGNNKILYELLKYLCNKDYIENVREASEICKIVKLEDRINNLQGIKKIGSNVKNLRYVIESDTLFVVMAKKTKTFNYLPLLKKEINRLASYSPNAAT